MATIGAASAVFVLDAKGNIIIYRDYRGDVKTNLAEKFIQQLNALEEAGRITPVIYHDGVSYIWTQYSNLYFLAVTRDNTNVTNILTFLCRLIDVLKYYFQELEEESLRDNFVIVYELLDEVMDYGYPQFTEAKVLAEYIKTDAHKLQVERPIEPPKEVTGAVSWRSEGIVHKKNEVFLDVSEKVNLLVNTNGTVVRSEILGSLDMRCFLSGMPDCKLGLNDKVLFEMQGRSNKGVELEDVKFHTCVRLSRFENDRTISFTPPDGAFQLMSYRLSQNITPLIWVECMVEKHSRSRTEYLVKARSQFKERHAAQNVEISIPLPKDATAPLMRASQGASTYVPEHDKLVWKIKNFPGGKEYLLRCKFSLPSVAAEDDVIGRMPPMTVNFEIPYFTVSGIQVRYLKVIEKSGYQALPWVRYVTKAGDYEIRMV